MVILIIRTVHLVVRLQIKIVQEQVEFNKMFKKGYKPTETHLKRLSESHLGITPVNKGAKMSQAFRDECRRRMTGRKQIRSEEGKKSFREKMSGPKNKRWNPDRSQIDLNKRRNWSVQCIEWREAIFKRDGHKCRISNEECSAFVEAHHILRWSEYPDLRFNINNGITLCRAHHPRKRAEEKRLIPVFRELVSVSTGTLS
jgi:hypothetical protein